MTLHYFYTSIAVIYFLTVWWLLARKQQTQGKKQFAFFTALAGSVAVFVMTHIVTTGLSRFKGVRTAVYPMIRNVGACEYIRISYSAEWIHKGDCTNEYHNAKKP